jgi:hypothetical protein
MNLYINDISCSFEEWLIFLYLEELKGNGFIDEIIFQPKPFELTDEVPRKFYKEKVDKKGNIKRVYTKKQNLLNKHIYTPDYKVIWAEKADGIFEQDTTRSELNLNIPFISNSMHTINSYLEVKAEWDKNNMTRMFTSHIQPYVYWKYDEYVQLVKPYDLFKETFVPKKAMEYMVYKVKTKYYNIGDKKFKWRYKTLEEYLNEKTR